MLKQSLLVGSIEAFGCTAKRFRTVTEYFMQANMITAIGAALSIAMRGTYGERVVHTIISQRAARRRAVMGGHWRAEVW